MKNKKIISIICIIIIAILSIIFLQTKGKSYKIEITIPAGSSETFVYSDVEISPKKNKITIISGEGLGDSEIVLKPIEVKEENIYEPTYITRGMPVKMDVEKGAWFKVGVNIQNSTDEDIIVCLTITDVELRIE